MRRAADWLRQAELDLAAAMDARASGHFEWACFLAQQSAEKAVKSAHESTGAEAWGHSVAGLLAELDGVPAEITEAGKALDKHYIPARYPNAHPGGAPGDLYTDREAQAALEDARGISSMSRVVIHRLDRDAVIARLREYAQSQLGSRPEVRQVTLIGSLARDDWSARSDADIVVVIDDSDRPFRERSPSCSPEQRLGVPMDVFVYTEAERESWGERFRAAVEGGLVLFER